MILSRVVRRNLPFLGVISCLVVLAFTSGGGGGGNEGGEVPDDDKRGGGEDEDARDVVMVGIDRA